LAEAVGAGDLEVEFGFVVIDGYCACFDYGDDLMLIVRIRILNIQIMADRRVMGNG
jgi:hypothetical protein